MTTTPASSPTPGPAGPGEPRTSARPSTRPGLPPRRPQLSEEERKARWEADVEATKNPEAAWKALAIAKLITEQGVICPKCAKGPLPSGKFKVQPSGMYKHFSSDGCSGDPASILQSVGVGFGDAVRALLGKPTRAELAVPDLPGDLAARFTGVKSKIDLAVFNGVLIYGEKTGGVQAAQEFYGTWHIAPEAVAESGAVYITDPKRFAAAILDRFGEERLLECGLFVRGAKGGLVCLVNDKFPVVEPHRHPVSGDVLYMQFRASHAQYQRYLDHKAGKRDYKGSEKIISLKGAPLAAQIGGGLPRVESLPPGSDVYVVEGFKDMLAVRTDGLEAYSLPGVGVRPPAKICQLLARHNVFVAFDGDEAGQQAMLGTEGRQGLVDYLRANGVASAQPKVLYKGLDATDILVSRHASGKATGTRCGCRTCARFRAEHPAWFPAAS